jgi:hypothetical protein
MIGTVYYRYVDISFSDGVRLILEKYTVERETPKGIWLLPPYLGAGSRWMRREGRFAHATKEAAWTSYRARKEAQQRHISIQRRRVKAALEMEFGDDERETVR